MCYIWCIETHANMKIIEGHLTATDKKALNAILSAKLDAGKVGKAQYFVKLENGVYFVNKIVKDRGLIPVAGSPLRLSSYKSKFTL